MTDCRDCKDYRECPYGTGLDYYHYGLIRFCPFQCIWIIANSGILEGGDWPKDPDNLDSNSGQRNLKAEARFTKPVLILAEVTYRLGRTGIQGKLLVAQIEAGWEFDDLDREARDALMYVKGFRRKKDNFVKWKKERKYRRKHTKRYEGNESNGHKHKYILDENNFGRCECKATKVNQDPDSWCNASVHGVKI